MRVLQKGNAKSRVGSPKTRASELKQQVHEAVADLKALTSDAEKFSPTTSALYSPWVRSIARVYYGAFDDLRQRFQMLQVQLSLQDETTQFRSERQAVNSALKQLKMTLVFTPRPVGGVREQSCGRQGAVAGGAS